MYNTNILEYKTQEHATIIFMGEFEKNLLYPQSTRPEEENQSKFSSSQQMYHHLREHIISLQIEPGEPLSRSELAKYYGLSQTPVRDVFNRLKQEGLLDIYPQSRTMVTKIDLNHARQTQFLRMALELEVGRMLALDKDKTKLIAIRHILDLQRLTLEQGNNLERFSWLDRSFHEALCAATGNRKLWHEVSARSGHIDRLRKLHLPDPGKAADIVEYHNKILSAIETSDKNRTEKMIRQHLSGTLSIVDAIVAQHPGFFSSVENFD